MAIHKYLLSIKYLFLHVGELVANLYEIKQSHSYFKKDPKRS